MRLPHLAERGSRFDVKMTPMIDVVFLLLIFFVWTASFQVVEQILPSRVSAESGGGGPTSNEPPPPEADFDRVIVRMQANAGLVVWTLNGQPLSGLAELEQRLRAIASIRRDAPVILHPDPAIALGTVIDAYDVSRLAGFAQVQFAASEGDAS